MFEYQMVNDGIKMTVHLKGDMDIEITEVMEEELIPALQKAQEVELNFAAVSFVDSTGIGLLMNLVQHLKEREILVKITHLSEDIYEVFDLLQIPDIIGRDVFSS
ncbi:STAS domain-containing protein [Neobacillus endophyticus]|uniref:STAS domain-containing protein n=1 Tax=Neobacillus endophyticus TaxID=2738405 RepID=UPI001FE2A19D|nr:STAS domain-containing protein [Neobacillus endophyticus]